MIDLAPYLKSRGRLTCADGMELLEDAGIALNAIGKKLEIMEKLATLAASPACDPERRLEMNSLFDALKHEIDDWAHTGTGGLHLLNYPGMPIFHPVAGSAK